MDQQTKMTRVEVTDEAWAEIVAETYDWKARQVQRECEQLMLEMVEFFGPHVGEP